MAKRLRRPKPPESLAEDSGFVDAYAAFARTLRLWFIAYGIGGPAAFLTNAAAGEKLHKSGEGEAVAYAFLAGVMLQIIMALIYKSGDVVPLLANSTVHSNHRAVIGYQI
jgi:hypothetical protein